MLTGLKVSLVVLGAVALASATRLEAQVQPSFDDPPAAAASGGASGAPGRRRARADDAYRPPAGSSGSLGTLSGTEGGVPPIVGSTTAADGWSPPLPLPANGAPQGDRVPPAGGRGAQGEGYLAPSGGSYAANDGYRIPADDRRYGNGGYGEPYRAPREEFDPPYEPRRGERYQEGLAHDRTFSRNEILDAGHRMFGSVSQGLASAVEYAFQRAGRPNGYILGEDAGGAIVAGLRYGEGTLFTKDAGNHKVFWQGPSLGYDFGGEGSKTMVLVYNLRDPAEIYDRFGGIQGSAYLVGGVSVQFQKNGDVMLALIRSGVGLRLGANIGYLKYTRQPTWNPF